jgi:Domain of unknown function (DUF1707)
MTGPHDPAAAGRGRLRVGHSDREQAIDTLKTAFVHGQLTKDEFDTRAGQALAARTYADLAALTADLPQPTTPRARRPLVIGLVVAAIVVVLLIVTAILAGLAGWGHMGPMMGDCCR